MTTQAFISVRDVQTTPLPDGYTITVTTDVPCHLFLRYTRLKPQKHIVPRFLRGIYLHSDVYLCFVAYRDNEQEEPGDTYTHTFIKDRWPHCQTRHFYFWGIINGVPSISTTAVFKLHFAAPSQYDYSSLYYNRHLYSNHPIWATARAGFNPRKDGNYQRPNNILIVRTELVATWHITRSYLNFHTHPFPTGKQLFAARLGLYIHSKPGPDGVLYITKGLWDEPVTPADWSLQTPEVTSLGSIPSTTIVPGQYIWIELNADGLAWINQRPKEQNQFESYDWHKAAYHLIYGNWLWSQCFTPQDHHFLTTLKLRLKRIGNPGYVYVNIHNAEPGGCPTGMLLAQDSRPGILCSTDTWGDWFDFDFPTPVPLIWPNKYAIRVWAPDGNSSNRIEWIGATGNWYPNGNACNSTDGGTTWTPYPNSDVYFIEYEKKTKGGTKFCLRTSPDLSGVKPPPGYHQEAHFYSAQKGEGYLPLLQLDFI